MSTTLDFPPVPRSRVTRASAPLSSADKAAGLRSSTEAEVFAAVRANVLRTDAAVARAAGIPEPAATKALRSLQDRGLVKRTTDPLGLSAYEASAAQLTKPTSTQKASAVAPERVRKRAIR